MELEDMKSTWFEMSQQLEKQKKMTNDIILKMTKENSKSRLNTLINFEILGMLISAVLMIYILTNFEQLDNWLSITGGLGTSIILLTGFMMSAMFIKRAKKIDILKKGYKQTLLDVTSLRKIQYINNWVSASLGILLPFFLLPTFATLYFKKDLLSDLAEYKESLIPSLILVPIIWYLFKRLYSKKLDEINELLQDIKQYNHTTDA